MRGRRSEGLIGRWSGAAWLTRLRYLGPSVHRSIHAAKRILGMPDYAAYCRHVHAHHPDRTLLSEREFFDQFLRARYGDGPTRCC